MSRGLESPYVVSIAFDAADRRVIYATTVPAALYRSVDGGETWEPLASLPATDVARRPPHVVTHPTRAGHLFVIDAAGALQSSRDGGQSWQDLGPISTMALYRFEKVKGGVLVNGWAGRVYRSTDDGRTF